MTSFKILPFLLSASFLFLTACDFSHKDPLASDGKKVEATPGQTNSNASFYVYFSNGDSQLNGVSGPLGLTDKRNFQFQACMKDHAFEEEIEGHEFEVLHNDVKVTEVTTQDRGCLHWKEELEFNPVMKAQYIVLERKIRAKGRHNGEQVIRFAVNPWNEFDTSLSIPAVISDITHDIPEGALAGVEGEQYMKGEPLALQKLKPEERPQLFFRPQDISTLINRGGFKKGEGYKLKFSLQMAPKVKVKNYNGDDSYIDITKGDFTATAWLLQRDEVGEPRGLYQVSKFKVTDPSSVRDNSLSFQFEFLVPYRKDAGRYELALKIVPKNSPDGLEHYEGAYALRDWNRIFFGKVAHEIKLVSLALKDKESTDSSGTVQYRPFNLPDYFSQKLEVAESNGFKRNDYKYSRVSFMDRGPMPEFDRNMDRVVKYQLRVCVEDPMENTPVYNRKFRVHKMQNPPEIEKELIAYENKRRSAINLQRAQYNKGLTPSDPAFKEELELYTGERRVETVETDDADSCFRFDDKLWHSYYDYARPIRKQIAIESIESGFKQKLDVVIMPWQLGNAVDGQDTQEDLHWQEASETVAHAALQNMKPKLKIVNYSISATKYLYEINNNLNLNVIHRYRLALDAKVIREDDSARGRQFTEDLRPGLYLVQLIVAARPEQMEALGSKDYTLTGWSGVSKVEDGKVIVDVELPFSHIPMLTAQNDLYIRIQPIDERKMVKNRSAALSMAREQLSAEDYSKLEAMYRKIDPDYTPIHSNAYSQMENSFSTKISDSSYLDEVETYVDRGSEYKKIEMRFVPYHAPIQFRGNDQSQKMIDFKIAHSDSVPEDTELFLKQPDQTYFDQLWTYRKQKHALLQGFTATQKERANNQQIKSAFSEFLNFNNLVETFYEVDLQDESGDNFVQPVKMLSEKLGLKENIRPLLKDIQTDYKKGGVLENVAGLFCQYYIDNYAEQVLGTAPMIDTEGYKDSLKRQKEIEDLQYQSIRHAPGGGGFMPMASSLKSEYAWHGPLYNLKKLCELNPLSIIGVDQKMFVEKIHNLRNMRPQFKGGYSQNYDYNSDYYVFRSNNRYASLSEGRESFFGLSGAFAGTSASVASSLSQTKERGVNARVGYHVGQRLVVQQAKFSIPVDAYRMCVVLQPKTKNLIKAMFNISTDEDYEDLFKMLTQEVQDQTERAQSVNNVLKIFGLSDKTNDDLSWDVSEINFFENPVDYISALPNKYSIRKFLREGVGNEDLIKFLTTGVVFCSNTQSGGLEQAEDGKVTREPLKIEENYYYIYQHFFSDSSVLYDNDLNNRPWLALIRGDRDYLMFRKFLEENGTPNSCDVDKSFDLYDSMKKAMTRSVNADSGLANKVNVEDMELQLNHGVYDRLLNHARFHTVLPPMVEGFTGNQEWDLARSLTLQNWIGWGDSLNDMQTRADCDPK